jgi:adenylate cyclase
MARAEVSAAPRLSEREHQIAERYVEGLSHKEIARALGIAPATVRTHVNAVYRKLEVTSRIQLLRHLQREAHDRPDERLTPDDCAGLAEEAAPAADLVRPTRRLLAILAADVVGYSRLVEADETGTIARLKVVRAEVAGPVIAGHRGRVVKLTGDGALVAFESAGDAVACAVGVQETLARRNATLPEAERIVFRIGVNVGDVVVEPDGDVLGDAVNIAARLEQLCEPGGITISGAVFDQVRGRIDRAIDFFGEQQVKNIVRPIRVYGVSVAGQVGEAALDDPPRLPDKPSLAVLPFQNMSDDPAQEYFADRMVEEITTALSRISGLFVIARNSSFTYKGRNVDVRQVARELGVRYVLEGSVRKVGYRVRITGQLVEAATGVHLWADRVDGSLGGVFELQDRVAEAVAGAIEPTLRRAEVERARRKPTDSLGAYDLYLRALPYVFAYSAEDNAKAMRLLDRALAFDQRYAVARAFKAWLHGQRHIRGWSPDDVADSVDKQEAELAARRVLTEGADDPAALAVAGVVLALIAGDHGAGLAVLDRARTLNPNSALAWGFGATVHCFAADYAAAINHAERALRLSPLDPMRYYPLVALACAALFTGRPGDAVRHAADAIQANAGFDVPYCMMIAGLVELGRMEEARDAGARLMLVYPNFTIARRRRASYRDTKAFERYLAALERAGLPP